MSFAVLLERIEAVRNRSGLDLIALAVDDGSRDGTFARLTESAPRFAFLRFVRHERNRGKKDCDGRPDREPEEIACWAREHELPYDDGHVRFPDARIEYEDRDGRSRSMSCVCGRYGPSRRCDTALLPGGERASARSASKLYVVGNRPNPVIGSRTPASRSARQSDA